MAARNISLRFSLSSAFVGIAVGMALLLGVATFVSVREYARNEIRAKMRSTIAVAALLVDPMGHDAILGREDEETERYKRIKAQLRSVRDAAGDIRFVYTFRKRDDGKLIFVVDAEDDPKEMSHAGDVYDSATPTLLATFEKPYEVRVETDFYTDKWGTWISAFAPIARADGTLAGVLGMDLSAAQMLAYERRVLGVVVSVSLGVCLFVAILGLFFARSISRPLTALAQEMNQVQSLALDGKLEVASRIDEVRNMGDALENMKMGLRSFRRYVPAELVTEVIGLHKEAVLSAEKREVTVFFSDVADFTTISEQLGTDRLSSLLGDYFEVVTKGILEGRGAVDKFIGDAVMAFWGAPKPLEDHAVHACLSALAVQRRLDEHAARWQAAGLPALHTRIGLNSGTAVVGNIGFKERLSYTALGDDVNLASRLEGLNKYYGTRILVSEHTYERAKHRIEARPIDNVVVKGKTKGVIVYELLGEKGSLTRSEEVDKQAFEEAMHAYLHREWLVAQRRFAEIVVRRPKDRPPRILMERCVRYVVEPPPADWTGAIFLREK